MHTRRSPTRYWADRSTPLCSPACCKCAINRRWDPSVIAFGVDGAIQLESELEFLGKLRSRCRPPIGIMLTQAAARYERKQKHAADRWSGEDVTFWLSLNFDEEVKHVPNWHTDGKTMCRICLQFKSKRATTNYRVFRFRQRISNFLTRTFLQLHLNCFYLSSIPVYIALAR